ncbi:galactose-3-O-sulfotransferase 3 [Tachyglossus aculeatus]|uniref:galactose-3-O-sulfotransferase 3 n=1 Tax=Tachyglossus aculeatus TaxID=9261 RepID=UPI0018F448CB|nr:galactose-3-O-sulfotransferase 3 [Tachyglossus aculeatus]
MAAVWPHLHRAAKMMTKRKVLLLVLGCSILSLLIHQGVHLSWSPKALRGVCPPPRGSPPRPKHTAVAFLKTHKTAGTTVQNILFRFAERHNLTVALPHPSCDHQFCYPRSFSARFVHPATVPARVLASHLRFNGPELRRLLPNDTVYVTIVREPGAMLESLFSYYNRYCPAFRRVPNASLEAFLREPGAYYRPGERYAMYAHNTLVYDLGGDNDRSPREPGYLAGLIRAAEEVFSLVMIAEYFDESLVLLRRLLAWDLEDVLYAKLNVRSPGSRRRVAPGALARAARAWNGLDAGLYDHFNATFWRRVARAGRACVEREARQLREARERLLWRCSGGRPPRLRPAAEIRNRDLRPWQPGGQVGIVGYDLPADGLGPGGEGCLKLAMPEVQYSRYLLRKQSRRGRARRRGPGPRLPDGDGDGGDGGDGDGDGV